MCCERELVRAVDAAASARLNSGYHARLGHLGARRPENYKRLCACTTRRKQWPLPQDQVQAPESMRGTGAAAALVEHMISDVRANGFKIIPICPYVQAQYTRHPEWTDTPATSTSSEVTPEGQSHWLTPQEILCLQLWYEGLLTLIAWWARLSILVPQSRLQRTRCKTLRAKFRS
jgi:predicted GNAT family acetyltransferase